MSVLSKYFPNPSSFADGAFRSLPRNGNVSAQALAGACRALLEEAGLDISPEAHRDRKVPVKKFGPILLDGVNGKPGVFVFQRRPRKGGRVMYGDIAACVEGKMYPLRVSARDVNHRGGIYPRKTDGRAIAKFNEQRRAGGLREVEGREGAASMLFTEWSKTAREDPDNRASPEYIPEDAERTLIFEVCQYIAEAYHETVRRRKAAGVKVLELCAEDDGNGIEKHAGDIATLCGEGALVSTDQLVAADLPNEPRITSVSAPRVYEGVSTKFSRNATHGDAGKPMLSGCARANFLLSETGTATTKRGDARATYCDKTKPFVNSKGRRDYEPLKNADGDLLSDANVHDVINSGTRSDVLIAFTMSHSPQGISLKREIVFANVTVRNTSFEAQSASDIFGDDYDGGSAAPAASSGGGGGGAPVPPASEKGDDDLADELGDIDDADLDDLMGVGGH